MTTFATARVTDLDVRAMRLRRELRYALRIVLADVMRTEGFRGSLGDVGINNVWCNLCGKHVSIPCPPGVQEFEDTRDQVGLLRKWVAAVEKTLAKHVCSLALEGDVKP